MSETVIVGISDMKMSTTGQVLVTYALGSCIGICLFEPTLKIGALGHIMLPYSPDPEHETTVFKYADTSIKEMLRQLQLKQCSPARLKAKIVGGAKMFEVTGDANFGNIGERNIAAVKKVLMDYHVPLYAQETGLNFGRTIFFDTNVGSVEIKSYNHPQKIL